MLTGSNNTAPQRMVLEGKLVIRESSGPLRPRQPKAPAVRSGATHGP